MARPGSMVCRSQTPQVARQAASRRPAEHLTNPFPFGSGSQRPPKGKAISSHRQQPCALRSPLKSMYLSQSQVLPSLSLNHFKGRAGLCVSVDASSLSSPFMTSSFFQTWISFRVFGESRFSSPSKILAGYVPLLPGGFDRDKLREMNG